MVKAETFNIISNFMKTGLKDIYMCPARLYHSRMKMYLFIKIPKKFPKFNYNVLHAFRYIRRNMQHKFSNLDRRDFR